LDFSSLYCLFLFAFGIVPNLWKLFKPRLSYNADPVKIRVFANVEEKSTIWDFGLSWVMFLAVTFGVLELFFLLPKFAILFQDVSPEGLRTVGFVLIYLFLFILGLIGNLTALTTPKMGLKALYMGLAGGFIGFFILLIINFFLSGLTLFSLLEAPVPPEFITTVEKIMYQVSFVAIGEELVFRQSLPFWMFQVLAIKLKKTTAVVIAFLISSILFGVVHFVAYNFNVIPLIFAVIAGIIFSVLKVQFGNLSNVIAHLAFNIAVISQFGNLSNVIAHLAFNIAVISQLFIGQF